jgi:Tol biopolymer transport system component
MGDANAMNIYTMAIGGERGEPEQITFFESFSDFPVWSPNGREIAFLSNQGGVFRVWRVGAKGGAPEPFEESSALLSGDDLAWAPGPNILYRSRSTELNNFMLLDPLSGSERPLLLDPQPGYVFEPVWAPDGKRIALFYNILEGNRQTMRAWVISLDDGSMSMLCDEVAYPISWSDDGRWIYIGKFDFGQSGKWATVFRVPSTGGDPEKYIQLPFDEGIDGGRITMTPDGRKFVYSKVETQTDIWIVEHFDPEVD